MKTLFAILLILGYQILNAQNLTFSNVNLKTYLLTQNSVDINGDEIPDTIIDINNDNEIQLSEALIVENLVISPSSSIIISSIEDLNQFSNLERLTIPGDFGLIEISNLNLTNLNFIRISDHNSINIIDLSDLPNLTSIILEGLVGVQELNIKNGSYASEAFSMFYTYVQSACVDNIPEEINFVSQHITNGGTISTDCSLGITDSKLETLKFFPNPTTDNINFNKNIDSVILYNINGEIIKKWSYPIKKIDISDVMTGIYILKIKNDDTIITERIIKK